MSNKDKKEINLKPTAEQEVFIKEVQENLKKNNELIIKLKK